MSRKRIKEEIGIVKVVLGLVIVADASVVAWVVQNFGNEAGWRLSLAIMAAVGLTILLAVVALWAARLLRALEDS